MPIFLLFKKSKFELCAPIFGLTVSILLKNINRKKAYFLEITKFGQRRVIFLTTNTLMFYTAIQDKNIMFSTNVCFANFSHILCHLKIVVFKTTLLESQKYFFMLEP